MIVNHVINSVYKCSYSKFVLGGKKSDNDIGKVGMRGKRREACVTYQPNVSVSGIGMLIYRHCCSGM